MKWSRKDESVPLLGNPGKAATGSGSFSSSVFMLANSACGSGVLAFPYAFRQAGDALALLMCSLFAVIMGFTLHTLVVAADQTAGSTYQKIVGRRIGQNVCVLIEVLIIVYEFFACVGFFIIIPNALEPLLQDVAEFSAYSEPSKRAIVDSIAGILVLPLMCCRKINSLRHTSTIAIFSILYLVVLVSYNGIQRLLAGGAVPVLSDSDRIETATPTDPWRAVPLICLALQCHIQIPAIYAVGTHVRRCTCSIIAKQCSYTAGSCPSFEDSGVHGSRRRVRACSLPCFVRAYRLPRPCRIRQRHTTGCTECELPGKKCCHGCHLC
jgi:amino acid permease